MSLILFFGFMKEDPVSENKTLLIRGFFFHVGLSLLVISCFYI